MRTLIGTDGNSQFLSAIQTTNGSNNLTPKTFAEYNDVNTHAVQNLKNIRLNDFMDQAPPV